MTGMEMMLGNMLKNMGIDKDALMSQANNAAAVVKGAETRLTQIEAQLQRIETKLDALVSPGFLLDNFAAHDAGQLTIFEEPKALPAVAHS